MHGLTGTSIELQPCLAMSWYDLDSNVARVCTYEQSTDILYHGLNTICKTISYNCCTVPSTVCYGLVRLDTTFTRFAGHLQGLHTVPPTFVQVILELSHIRIRFDINLTRFDGWASQIFELSTEQV